MTLIEFTKIVKSKYVEAEVFKHGEFTGNKINVAVIFNPNGKVYQYNGTYCEVLNKLGIKAIYRHNFESAENTLNRYINENGTKDDFFGIVNDYTKEIAEWTERIKDYKANYIIV